MSPDLPRLPPPPPTRLVPLPRFRAAFVAVDDQIVTPPGTLLFVIGARLPFFSVGVAVWKIETEWLAAD